MSDDKDRFNQYFTARQASLRRTAYLLCGDWHWADDLTQTAFVRLAAAWHQVRDPGAVDAFVKTCLVRVYLAENRRAFRRRENTVAEPPDRPGRSDDAETVTRQLVFARALGQLPPRQRATLVCRFYQELDVAATATTLGCSEGTVKSQTARGLAALRTALTGSGYDLTPLSAPSETG